MTDVSIGKLDQRLMLQEAVRSSDGAGGAAVGWSLIAEVWASVRPVSGAERSDGEALRGRLVHEVWLRHRDGVKPQMRFLLGTRVLEITSVLEAGQRRRYLKCLCEERAS